MDGEEAAVIFARRRADQQRPLVALADVELECDNERGAPLLPLECLLDVYEQIDEHETAARLEAELG